jgi:hypothetical protein
LIYDRCCMVTYTPLDLVAVLRACSCVGVLGGVCVCVCACALLGRRLWPESELERKLNSRRGEDGMEEEEAEGGSVKEKWSFTLIMLALSECEKERACVSVRSCWPPWDGLWLPLLESTRLAFLRVGEEGAGASEGGGRVTKKEGEACV